MNYSEQIIKECVKRFEQEYIGYSIYSECLEVMSEIDLEGITEKEVDVVIKPFLYEWGRMGRVLGRVEFLDWTSNLAEQIRTNCETLKDFRTKDLADVDLSKFESDIKRCYEFARKAVGQIAAAKVLHLVCPNFFPLWDNPIAKAVRTDLKGKAEGNNKVENFSGADYYRFMGKIQNFIKEYEKVLSNLVGRYRKGKLKILDECLWWITQRPLSLLV